MAVEPSTATVGEPRGTPRRGRLSAIVSGLGWNTVGQGASVGVYAALTPYLVRHLGLDRYGLYSLLSTFVGLLSNLDGGLGWTATRFFSVYVGANDRRRTSELYFSISVLLFGLVGAIALVVAIAAPYLTSYLHAARGLHGTAVLLLRAFMPLMLLASLRGVARSLVAAHERWAYLNLAGLMNLAVFASLAFLLVSDGDGLVGLLWASVAQQASAILLTLLGSRGMVRVREFRLLPWPEIRSFAAYGARVQLMAVANVVNLELDAVVVSVFLPLNFVALYAIGANFAQQIRQVPMNAGTPLQVSLARSFGRSGMDATIAEHSRLQRGWVRAVAAYCLIGAVSAYVAIPHWIGPQAQLAGEVAAILLAGYAVHLLTMVLSSFVNAVGRPGLEARYGTLSMVVNVLLTVPLAYAFGDLGVAAGTAVGLIVGSIYLQRIVRRKISAEVEGFLGAVPVLRVLVALGVTGGLEAAMRLVAPVGVGGLVLCAVPAALGLGAYALMLGGPRAAATFLQTRLKPSPPDLGPAGAAAAE